MDKVGRGVSAGIFSASNSMAFNFNCRNTRQAKRAGNATVKEANVTVHPEVDRFRSTAAGTLMNTTTLGIDILKISDRNLCYIMKRNNDLRVIKLSIAQQSPG